MTLDIQHNRQFRMTRCVGRWRFSHGLMERHARRQTMKTCVGVWLLFLMEGCVAGPLLAAPSSQEQSCFAIQVVDADTGRGIPLVELRTTNHLLYITDSAGWVAFDEPGLLGETVFFHISSHGYEAPKDGLGQRGRALKTSAGAKAKIELRRLNLAERLYRVTGQGIYSDSVRLGLSTPLQHPLISGQVMGQDSVQNAVLDGELFWFWGDTNRPRYPLGHFATSAARSRLPANGGLSPHAGVDLDYYVDRSGFSEPAFEVEGGKLVWLDGVMVVENEQGEPQIVGHYNVMKSLAERLEHGLAVFDPSTGKFKRQVKWPAEAALEPHGQVMRVTDDEGDYFYFCNPFPRVRVKADWKSVFESREYEAYTPLAQGEVYKGADSKWAFNEQGQIVADWKRETPALTPQEAHEMVAKGDLSTSQARWNVLSADANKRVTLQSGNVAWNKFRQKYVMIAVELFGEHSVLGDVWYVESDRPEGPWTNAVRVAIHESYSFYNPRHHPYFDEEEGRYIYFEGTYTSTFSKAKYPTPRYDYNQVMYRLDLADPRLQP
jgi:hypothetical protein